MSTYSSFNACGMLLSGRHCGISSVMQLTPDVDILSKSSDVTVSIRRNLRCYASIF